MLPAALLAFHSLHLPLCRLHVRLRLASRSAAGLLSLVLAAMVLPVAANSAFAFASACFAADTCGLFSAVNLDAAFASASASALAFAATSDFVKASLMPLISSFFAAIALTPSATASLPFVAASAFSFALAASSFIIRLRIRCRLGFGRRARFVWPFGVAEFRFQRLQLTGRSRQRSFRLCCCGCRLHRLLFSRQRILCRPGFAGDLRRARGNLRRRRLDRLFPPPPRRRWRPSDLSDFLRRLASAAFSSAAALSAAPCSSFIRRSKLASCSAAVGGLAVSSPARFPSTT